MAGAAFGSCLKGWDVVARAARGVRNRGRRSTLEMPLPKSWQAQHSVHLSVCLRGRGSIWQLSKGMGCCRARLGARGIVAGAALWRCRCRSRGRRSTLEMPLPKSWQAQHSVHLSVCLLGRGSIWQLSKGMGWCRARGSGRAKSWQAQHFEDVVAEVVAGAAFCASERVFAWQGQHLAASIWQHLAASIWQHLAARQRRQGQEDARLGYFEAGDPSCWRRERERGALCGSLGGAGGPSETEARPGGLDFDCWGDAHSGWAELLDFTAAVSLAGEGHGGCECHRAEAGRFALAERASLGSRFVLWTG